MRAADICVYEILKGRGNFVSIVGIYKFAYLNENHISKSGSWFLNPKTEI